MYQSRDIRFPVGFLVVLESTEHIEQRLFKTLWHSIAHRVVGRGPRFFYVGNGTQLFDILTFEIASLFAMERGWSGGAMVLGKLPVPGRPTFWIQ